jgi:hypothetical protein
LTPGFCRECSGYNTRKGKKLAGSTAGYKLPAPAALAMAMEPHRTSLLALEIARKLWTQLRHALEAAGITDLTQLQGKRRSEVRLLRGISSKSLQTIDAVMREAGIAFLDEGRLRAPL